MSLGLRADPTNTSAVISVAGTDQVVITNAGNVTANTFTGTLAGNATSATKLSTATGTAPSYSARAWVSFAGAAAAGNPNVSDYTNTNRYIFGSQNVTNVLRVATGAYRIFFATQMPDANYAFSFSAHHLVNASPNMGCSAFSIAADSIGVYTFMTYQNNLYQDSQTISVTIFR